MRLELTPAQDSGQLFEEPVAQLLFDNFQDNVINASVLVLLESVAPLVKNQLLDFHNLDKRRFKEASANVAKDVNVAVARLQEDRLRHRVQIPSSILDQDSLLLIIDLQNLLDVLVCLLCNGPESPTTSVRFCDDDFQGSNVVKIIMALHLVHVRKLNVIDQVLTRQIKYPFEGGWTHPEKPIVRRSRSSYHS